MEARFNLPCGLCIDAKNRIFVADYSGQLIRCIQNYKVCTIAGTGEAGHTDGRSPNACFNYPFGVSLDPEGNLYVADSQNFSVRKVRTDGIVETVKYDLNVSKIFKPLAIAYDHKGNIIIADGENNKIIKLNRKGVVKTVAGDGSKGFKDGSPLEATFNGPRGLTLDNYGNVIVADTDNHAIRVIYLSGENKRVATIGGTGNPGYCDGNFMNSQFHKPHGVAVDAYDNILVADSRNNRIRIIHSDGTVSTVAGDGKEGFKDGLARCAQFNCPKGIAIDLSGDIILSDGYNHCIRKIYSSYIQNSTLGLLKGFYSDDTFCDHVIRLQDEDINVHRSIFEVRCPSLLQNIELNMEPETFSEMAHFIYTDTIDCDDLSTLFSLLQEAQNFNLPSLQIQAINSILYNLSLENVLQVLIESAELKIPQITTNAIKWWRNTKVEITLEDINQLFKFPDIVSELFNSKEAVETPMEFLPVQCDPSTILSVLERSSRESYDTVLKVNSEIMFIHECVVGSKWPNFLRLFKTRKRKSLKPSQSKSLNILEPNHIEIPAPTLNKLIRYFYHPETFLDFTYLDCIWVNSVAEQYEIYDKNLLRLCAKRIDSGEIGNTPWFDLLQAGLKLNVPKLIEMSSDKIPEQCSSVDLVEHCVRLCVQQQETLEELREYQKGRWKELKEELRELEGMVEEGNKKIQQQQDLLMGVFEKHREGWKEIVLDWKS